MNPVNLSKSNKKKLKHGLLLALMLMVWFYAGYPFAKAQSYSKVNHFAPEQYKGGNQNWDISLAADGTVFIANNEGLIVEDGTGSKLYQLPTKTIIRSVAVVGERIYTGSFEEFGFWTKNEDESYSYRSMTGMIDSQLIANQEIWKIVAHQEKIYFQSFGLLLVFDGNTVQRIELPGSILFLLQAADRLFTQQVNGLLYELIQDRLEPVVGSDFFSDTEIKSVILLDDGKLLIGTSSKGLFVYEDQQFELWPNQVNESLKQYTLNNGVKIGHKLVFGTILQGVYIVGCDGIFENHLNSSNALQNNTILALKADQDENLWVGMDKGYDFIWFKSPIENYHEPDFNIGSVYSACLFRNKLYVGTNQGVYFFDMSPEGKFTNKQFVENTQGQTWFLKVIDDKLYCGLNEGTFVIEHDKLVEMSDVNGGYNLERFSIGSTNYFLQSTYSELVIYQKTHEYWSKSKTLQGFLAPARFLQVDHLGSILLGHSISGIYFVQPNVALDSAHRIEKLGETQGLNFVANRIFNVDNRLIIPSGDSLFQWDAMHEKVVPFPELNQQLGSFSATQNIAKVGSQQYWLFKDNEVGLFEVRFGLANMLYRLIPDLYELQLIENYENVVALNDSLHLICLENGFSVLNLNRLNRLQEINHPPRIKQIVFSNGVNDRKFMQPAPADEINMSNLYNSIQFTFTNDDLVGRKKYFQYRLTGLDTDWGNWTSQSKVEYSRLPAGKYRFELRSLTVKGIETEIAAVDFTIRQPWFLSWIALLIDGLLLISLLILLRINYKRRLWRQQKKELERDHEQLRKQKEQAEAEMIKLSNDKLQFEISQKNMQLAKNTMAMVAKNELLIDIKSELDLMKEELGYRLPNKYYDNLAKLIEKGINSENDWEMFEHLFDQAHQNFFKRLKNTYPDLTSSDLRLCAYLRLNLSSKEIAPLLNISVRGVEEKRYRLRKRLGLSSDQGLTDFIIGF